MMKPAIIVIFFLGIAVLGLAGCKPATNGTNNVVGPVITDTKWEGLAKALTSAGAKMYGAYWCSHCQDQKADFGTAFQYVTYIECAPDKTNPYKIAEACKVADIQGYPTWVFNDGSRVERVMTFDELAQKINYQAN